MLNKFKILVAAVALSGTMGANVQAATVTVENGDTLWGLSQVHKTSVEDLIKINHLSNDNIHPGDVLTITEESVSPSCTVWDQARHLNKGFLIEKKWNKNISAFIHPEKLLKPFSGIKVVKQAPAKAAPLVKSNEVKKRNIVVSPALVKTEVIPAAPKVCPEKTKVEAAPKEKAPTAVVPTKAPESNTAPKVVENSQANDDKEILVKATAYTASCEGCSGITATGVNIKDNPDEKIIAVDPTVIPLGSKVYVEGFGEAVAGDTGGAIKGNRIDVFIPSEDDAIDFGVKRLKVTILN